MLQTIRRKDLNIMFAGFVTEDDNSDYLEVLCVTAVHDWYAEILARRCFQV